ncbi:MAG: hypothetical protein LC649_04220 [Bacteroidales bacterium]|nr:hypothetical protein [Bacteroidales bacterium]
MPSILNNKPLLVFLLALAVISGPAWESMDKLIQDECVDCQTYLALAKGDFDQSAVRRYRIIIPVIAGSLDMVVGRVMKKVKPETGPNEYSLHLSFLIVNSLMMSLFALLVYRLALTWVSSDIPVLLALLALLTCRWTAIFTGWPLTDSLYFVAITLALLGIREKNSAFILISIILGPWAKESYIIMAPLVLFYAPVKKWRVILWFLISGTLVFTFRFLFDYFAGLSFREGVIAGPSHIEYIGTSLIKIFSLHGLYQLLSVTGIWVVLLLLPSKKGDIAGKIFGTLPSYMWWYTAVVLLQMLLSTDIARMFYLIMPLLVTIYAIKIDSFTSGVVPANPEKETDPHTG